MGALGGDAQSLHHLNYLIVEPVKVVAVYQSGVLVQTPRPERFAIHKLIVADRRRDGTDGPKAEKDRLQAAFLIGVLAEDRPDELFEAYQDAHWVGSKRAQRIASTQKLMPRTRKTTDGLS